MTPRYIFILILMASVVSPVLGQTLHRNDLPLFFAKFPRRHLERDTAGTAPARLEDWQLGTLDSLGRHVIPEWMLREEWTLLDTAGQNGRISPYYEAAIRVDGTGEEYILRTPPQLAYQYWLMQDVGGYGSGSEVLTVWRVLGDSLQFVCAQLGPFGGNLSRGFVKHVTLFPDMSVLLHVCVVFGDAGDYFHDHSYFRGTDSCGFVRFYTAGWDDESMEEVYYEFARFTNPFYQVIEMRPTLVPDSRFEDIATGAPLKRFDSVSARVIDLWSQAKAHFNIDTTKLELRYK